MTNWVVVSSGSGVPEPRTELPEPTKVGALSA
jgi:hypothetical protein